MIGLVVVRSFHFARAAILPQVAGPGKDVVTLFWFLMRQDLFLIGSGLVHRLRKNRGLRRGRQFGSGMFHKAILFGDRLLLVVKMLLSGTAEAEPITGLAKSSTRARKIAADFATTTARSAKVLNRQVSKQVAAVLSDVSNCLLVISLNLFRTLPVAGFTL